MTDINEPTDGGYVAARYLDAELGHGIYRRRDNWAEHNDLGEAHWFSRTDENEPARTWAWLTERYEIAYVGEFVDRHVKFEGEPWASL